MTTSLSVSKVTAHALKVLTLEQLEEVSTQMNQIQVAAAAMDVMEMGQLIELATRIAAEGIKAKQIALKINDEQIDNGALDYQLQGDTEYLMLIAENMADRGTLDFEKDPKFHSVGAVITAAQMVADDIGGEKVQPILDRGKKLADMQLGSKERAEETKSFLEDLFGFLKTAIA